MQNYITFWELSPEQFAALNTYCSQNQIIAPDFGDPYEGFYYLEQNADNLADYGELFEDFDLDDGIPGNSFGSRSWSGSTVPSALWP